MAETAPDLIRRQLATQDTLLRFRGKPFDWKAGLTCVHLAHYHLQRMGHAPRALPGIGSLRAARRALAERGWADCHAMLAAQPGLAEIPPAAMLMGDLATCESADGLGGIVICAGPRKVFGWREDAPGLVVLDVSFDQFTGAFRV